MKIIQTISQFQQIPKGCVLTIGNFDGVHVGHQEILAVARKAAEQNNTELIAMVFDPHPVAILHPEMAPGVLTPLDIKKHLLAQYGVDRLIVLRTNHKLLELSPEDFVKQFLVENIKPDLIVEGDDFNFGAERAGNIDTLKKSIAENNCEVRVIGAKKIKLSTGQTVRISSTMIRYMLEGGHVADAAIALGRPYRICERIIQGRGVGIKLGFPTLNMKKPKQVIPAEGVYAGYVKIGQVMDEAVKSKEKIPAVYSIGQARTYGDDFPLLIEAHLLIENVGDLIGRYMTMDFVQRIRNQHKFKSPEDLSKQIAKDCYQTRKILAAQGEDFASE
ncbi:MAG: bifunctional riboflavin kinase/FAD synthetase [Sedimentisphaerales bacterium]|nr:bifunctional riboflavin kinase/FAD synthetase [Sedimentisphaerales bacterium]